MVLIADNDELLGKQLRDLCRRHGFEAEAVPVAQAGSALQRLNPRVLAAGIVLHRDNEGFVTLNGLYEEGMLENSRVFCILEPQPITNPGVRSHELREIRCDAYCDKPVDAVSFISTLERLYRGVRT
jgi:hypothetical protein